MTKTPKIGVSVSADKKPHAIEKAESAFDKSPSWRFSRADMEHLKWSVLDCYDDVVNDPNDSTGTSICYTFSKSIDKVLLDALKDRESTTWAALLTQSGGRTHGTNSHHIPMYKLIKEAQERAKELGIVEDELLSLRLTGTQRVFGVLEGGVLNIVWFDRTHEICPSTK